MSHTVTSENFEAEYYDDDVEHDCPAKWYVKGRAGTEVSRDFADYAEYTCEAYVGTGGYFDWELDPETMMRQKLTIQAALESYEKALDLYTTYNGIYPDSAIYVRASDCYRSPTPEEEYGV